MSRQTVLDSSCFGEGYCSHAVFMTTVSFECDEPADCAPGLVCIGVTISSFKMGGDFKCRSPNFNSPYASEFRLCRSPAMAVDGPCPAGEQCVDAPSTIYLPAGLRICMVKP